MTLREEIEAAGRAAEAAGASPRGVEIAMFRTAMAAGMIPQTMTLEELDRWAAPMVKGTERGPNLPPA
jgi:hypothetical protein